MPAATPKSDAVRLRMLEMTCGESKSVTVSCRAEAQQDRLCRMPGNGNDTVIDKRTWVLCCTLLATIGLMASSRSSFSADAAMTDNATGVVSQKDKGMLVISRTLTDEMVVCSAVCALRPKKGFELGLRCGGNRVLQIYCVPPNDGFLFPLRCYGRCGGIEGGLPESSAGNAGAPQFAVLVCAGTLDRRDDFTALHFNTVRCNRT